MKRPFLYSLYGLGALLVLGALAFKIFQPVQVVPRIRPAPGFALMDQTGQRLTSEDMRGRFVLYNFLYTGCEPPCYNLIQTMQAIQTRIAEAELGDIPISYVTISFDTEKDTPQALQTYAEALGLDLENWHFISGDDPAQMKTIIGAGFEAYYQPRADGGFNFDPKFVLVDGWGIIRGEYKYQTLLPDTDRILRHIGVMAEEVHNSQGAATLAYEAAHYFLCYTP